ncbi:RDD family protein [Aliarcobacter skirrowii]|uniref:RDD family protein n=1 Tax=Aliarcobacter skirrowii TaxID=28200 RepID=UPI0029B618AE|nr:RDD family protein [Aliarcobacter skirrowii]MDX4035131.1 RDD family protein [Aliarcobacter skirrowii]MDX4049159.1 RDD family protein [Aliarcobacter skirrowii]MDX4065125.1 RDD family protein [Aliarcobacter skirrowii]MDX4067979.1 RDD family protein [Aliarcobacter skirrowii]
MAKWRDVKQNRAKNIKAKTVLQSSSNFVPLFTRFKAFLTDFFLITTPILYIVIYLIMGGGVEFSQNRLAGWAIILFTVLFIIAIFWLKSGQTPGLKAYDLKLVDRETKSRITVMQVLIRYFVTLFSIILFAPLFFAYFNKDRKTIQDILSKTDIVNEKDAIF